MGRLILFSALFPDGCYRKAAQRLTTPAVPTTPTTTVDPSHKVSCLSEEVSRTQCLHGGSCFAVILNNGIRSSGCSCTDDWWGERCQYRFIDPEILAVREGNMRTAHIAAGVSVCIVVVFVILLAVYVYIRARKKDKKGHTRLPRYKPDAEWSTSPRPPAVNGKQQSSTGEDSCMVDGAVSSSADNGNLGRPFNASADNLRFIDEGSDDFTLERMNSIKETGL